MSLLDLQAGDTLEVVEIVRNDGTDPLREGDTFDVQEVQEASRDRYRSIAVVGHTIDRWLTPLQIKDVSEEHHRTNHVAIPSLRATVRVEVWR